MRLWNLLRRRRRPVPRGIERVCVGIGTNAGMMLKAREITRAPVLGVGVALTDNDHPLTMERVSDDTWRLFAWIDRDADYREHKRLKRLGTQARS